MEDAREAIGTGPFLVMEGIRLCGPTFVRKHKQ